ncbi:biotin carboxyl carrier protein [Streptomyces sp. LBL]|uniref:hypothetical protein n=1 Tax=Streptomyces sp. LBL TaxID=2940562 RepID=UPI002475A202|nr:hypothetical protein [Streptomyces sp. LBL]MDH6627447.1 biotin carboxyl carrier protein [Streptomyces sp. LBL]
MDSRAEQRTGLGGGTRTPLAMLWAVLGVLLSLAVCPGHVGRTDADPTPTTAADVRATAAVDVREDVREDVQAYEGHAGAGHDAPAQYRHQNQNQSQSQKQYQYQSQYQKQNQHDTELNQPPVAAERPQPCPSGTRCFARPQLAALHSVRTTLPGTVQALAALLPRLSRLPAPDGRSGPAERSPSDRGAPDLHVLQVQRT